ncbi:hypothetical protein ES705_37018 [subsurface metagenome]
MNPFTNPIAFYFDKPTNEDNPLDILKPYIKDGVFLLAYEAEPRPHYHCLADLDTKAYNAFVATILRTKWNLRGKAQKGLPKQYGRVLGIKKPDKMLAYTMKQGIYQTNIPDETLIPFKEMAYTKDKATDDRELRDKCLLALEEGTPIKSDERLKIKIIKWMLENNIFIRNKNSVDCYFRHIRQFSTINRNHSAMDWYHDIYNIQTFN